MWTGYTAAPDQAQADMTAALNERKRARLAAADALEVEGNRQHVGISGANCADVGSHMPMSCRLDLNRADVVRFSISSR